MVPIDHGPTWVCEVYPYRPVLSVCNKVNNCTITHRFVTFRMKQSLFHLVDRYCVQSELWSIGTVVNINVVNQDRDQSAPWSIGTVVNINVVNRDCGQYQRG